MEELTFKLEGVVHVKDDTEDFEGPLNLILQLLSKNKIEIKDIKISEILEQYLEYLDEMKRMDLEIASEFVAMASHLVYIKTRTLLAADDEEITELQMLINSLEELKHRDCYAGIKAVIAELETNFIIGRDYISKPSEPLKKDKNYEYKHDKNDLLSALKDMFEKADAAIQMTKPQNIAVPQPITYSVSRKTQEIVDRIKNGGKLTLKQLFGESESRSELVAAFISILELCKMGSIILADCGDDFTVNYTGVYDPVQHGAMSAEKGD